MQRHRVGGGPRDGRLVGDVERRDARAGQCGMPRARALPRRGPTARRVAPDATMRCAVAKPMPPEPPVMTATRPSRSMRFMRRL